MRPAASLVSHIIHSNGVSTWKRRRGAIKAITDCEGTHGGTRPTMDTGSLGLPHLHEAVVKRFWIGPPVSRETDRVAMTTGKRGGLALGPEKGRWRNGTDRQHRPAPIPPCTSLKTGAKYVLLLFAYEVQVHAANPEAHGRLHRFLLQPLSVSAAGRLRSSTSPRVRVVHH
jgi:hypothetical protein